MPDTHTTTIKTPIGCLRLCAIDDGLTHVFHKNQQADLDSSEWVEDASQAHLKAALVQLREYFDCMRKTFDVPLAPQGTPFQLRVWEALQTIPYGQTTSYAAIAELIGNPKAVRAVGAANGRNPLSIFVPCHRVIGSSGKLTGYAGGLDNKSVLLSLEQGVQLLL